MQNIKTVCVAGGGIIGSQIAFQSAFKGKKVKVWSRRPESMERAKKKLDDLHAKYHSQIDKAKNNHFAGKMINYPRAIHDDPKTLTEEKAKELHENVDRALKEIEHELSLEKAVENTDLVIEAIIENKNIKSEFFKTLAPFLPKETILATNTSNLIPSMFAQDTGRPDKFLALHFANNIWRRPVTEIMAHAGTDPKCVEILKQFSKEIGMNPYVIKKEIPCYIMNTLLGGLLEAADNLWVNGYADYKDIDDIWKLSTGAVAGPFEMLDAIGIETHYHSWKLEPDSNDPNSYSYKVCAKFKERMDKGLLGKCTGEGFYKYNPEDDD